MSIFHVGSSVLGDASTNSVAGTLQLSTGIAEGTSLLEWDYFVNGAGQADGQATMLGDGRRIVTCGFWIHGTSQLVWSGAPMPIWGHGIMVGEPVVDHHLPAINAVTCPPKTFRYLQWLQRGDLPLYLCDFAGPVSPTWVRFTLQQVLPCGTRRQVGPGQRTPVQGDVGEYYAVGRAGETGQPGNWVIVWEFRRNFQSATQSTEMQFRVLDAVSAADPRDVTVRCRKYGWS
jgi:hypothetical protein